MVRSLRRFRTATWEPFDHGALEYPYYVLRGYDPPRLVNPTRMPAVLSEGLFLSNPRELRLLKRPQVRSAMAGAYYEAIASYLRGRGEHVGYRFAAGSPTAHAERLDVRVEVRNHGSRPVRGWRLEARLSPASDATRDRSSRRVARVRIGRLRPGQGRLVRLRLAAPDSFGRWDLVVDARDRRRRSATRLGVPALRIPLVVGEPVVAPAVRDVDPALGYPPP
jgi:hypothetical protein